MTKQESKKQRAVVCVTGASGVIIATFLLKHLLLADADIFCVVSDAAKKIIPVETDAPDLKSALKNLLPNDPRIDSIKFFDEDNFNAPPASGSFYFDSLVIIPCSMKTLGKIANGIADNLIVRAADVALKERRRIVVCPRETPIALTHIRNMETIALAGAIVMPPAISFYNKPKTANDVADFIAARITQSMGFKQSSFKEWGL